jgi:hypothetical protein
MLGAAAAAQNRRKIPPPIPLVAEKTKTALTKGSYLTMELSSSPGVAGSPTFKKDIAFFKDGTPEDYLEWHDNLMLVLTGQSITDGPAQYAMARRLLQGSALASFENASTAVGAETVVNFLRTLTRLKAEVFPKRALRTQLRYYRRYMRKPAEMSVRQFFTRAEEIHGMMANFPRDGTLNANLPEGDRIDVYEGLLPNRWQNNFYALGYDPIEQSLKDLQDHAERQEVLDGMNPSNAKRDENKKKTSGDSKPGSKSKNRNNKRQKTAHPRGEPKDDKDKRFNCRLHGNNATHDTHDCSTLKKQAENMKATYEAQGNRHNKYKKVQEAHTAEAVKSAIKALMKESGNKKRKSDDRAQDSDQDMNNIEEFLKNAINLDDSDDDVSVETA